MGTVDQLQYSWSTVSSLLNLHIPIITWCICILWTISVDIFSFTKTFRFFASLSVKWSSNLCGPKVRWLTLDFTTLGTFTRPNLPVPECPTPKGQLNPVSAPNLRLWRGQKRLTNQEHLEGVHRDMGIFTNLYFFLCIICHISSPKWVGIIGTQVVWSSQVKRGCVILCEPHLTPLCKIIISHLLRTQL